MTNETIRLFDEEDIHDDNEVEVVDLSFLRNRQSSWQDLFSGFDELKAITYSSSMHFVDKVTEMFEQSEIIFGNEVALSNDIADLVAFQNQVYVTIHQLKSHTKRKMVSRMEAGMLKLFVAKTRLSHEKIYILKSNKERYRVITGSANMSQAAFTGKQRETINVIDGLEAYEYYLNQFERLKEDSVNQIQARSLVKITGDILTNYDLLPITDEVNEKKVFEVIDIPQSKPQMEFIQQLIQNARKLKPHIQVEKTKNGRTTITYTHFHQAIRKVKTSQDALSGDISKVLPELIIDTEKKEVKLQGEIQDLNPNSEDIRKDVRLFLDYMKGFDTFHGDKEEIEQAKRSYYRFANWFFVSPLLSSMRLMAIRYDKKPDAYPVFGLIYGNSKAGKTSFLITLLHFMINQSPKLGAGEFTIKSVNDARSVVKGVPIIYDDMVYSRFNNHAAEVIKNDDFGYHDNLSNFPVVVISANEDVKVVSGDLSRRTVLCKVNIGLDTKEVLSNNAVKRIQRQVSTALYRAYLGRMLEGFDEFVLPMFNPEEDYSADILYYSSKVLRQLFLEYSSDPLPEYLREIHVEEYFDERITSNYAKRAIKTAWQHNKKQFVINRKTNTFKYTAEDSHEIGRMKKELPDSLNPKISNKSLILDLEKASAFFEIDFRKKFKLFRD